MKSYVTKPLAALLIAGMSMTGCETMGKASQEMFRSNEKINEQPLSELLELDYKQPDEDHKTTIQGDRAYRTDEAKPPVILSKDFEVPQLKQYRLPTNNAKYVEIKDQVILTYRPRKTAQDLGKQIEPYLEEGIIIAPDSTRLILSGPKTAFGDFKDLSSIINTFDVPADLIAINLRIVEVFDDNTYDRGIDLAYARKTVDGFRIGLPSGSDPDKPLTTGININPWMKRSADHTSSLLGAFKILDSYGKIRTVADIDVIVQDGNTAEFKNLIEIPYPITIVNANNIVDTVEYKPTGFILNMSVNSNDEGFINVKINQAQSGEATLLEGTTQRQAFRTADFKSEFIVRDGVPMIIATAITTRYKTTDRGIPGIRKVPFFRRVLSAKTIEHNESQLYYLATIRTLERDDTVRESFSLEKLDKETLEEAVVE